jgi:hypothetical protein
MELPPRTASDADLNIGNQIIRDAVLPGTHGDGSALYIM